MDFCHRFGVAAKSYHCEPLFAVLFASSVKFYQIRAGYSSFERNMFTSPGTAFHSHLCSDTLDYLAIGTNRSEASLSARNDLLSGKNDHVMIMYECMGFVFWPPTGPSVWVGPPVWDFQLCDLGEFQNFKPTGPQLVAPASFSSP